MAVKAFGTEVRAKFKDLTFEEILENCAKDNQMGWLEEAMERPIEHWKWQRRTEVDENGKKRKVVDKTLPKVKEYRKPTFIELKEMYLVELCGVPAAKKKPKVMTMADKLALKLAEMADTKEKAADAAKGE